MSNCYQALVIGVSAGGFKALHTIMPPLPGEFPLPVVVVQHRKAESDNYLLESLNKVCNLNIKEADEKEKITPGTVYFAPAGYHLLIEKDQTFSLSVDEPICYARPSIDVLFETAAQAYKSHLIGIVLTGANNDGSNGIVSIKQHNGLTIVQAPETAEMDIMPLAAIATKSVDYILALEEIPVFLNSLVEKIIKGKKN